MAYEPRPCVSGNRACPGPVAPLGSEVCDECAAEYAKLVERGEIEDFVNDDDRPEVRS